MQSNQSFTARVYNPGELASELARFESGTSSKFQPAIPSALRPKPRPHKLECASGSGTQQGEGDASARRSNSARRRPEVKCRNNKQHRVTFQNKTLHVDTSSRGESAVYYTARGGLKPTSGDCRKAEQNRIGAATQRTISSGNWADSLAILMTKNNTQRS